MLSTSIIDKARGSTMSAHADTNSRRKIPWNAHVGAFDLEWLVLMGLGVWVGSGCVAQIDDACKSDSDCFEGKVCSEEGKCVEPNAGSPAQDSSGDDATDDANGGDVSDSGQPSDLTETGEPPDSEGRDGSDTAEPIPDSGDARVMETGPRDSGNRDTGMLNRDVSVGRTTIGNKCTSDSDCGPGRYDECRSGSDWKDGYCSEGCRKGTNNSCPNNSHCAFGSRCMKTCTASSQCRSDGYSCYDQDGDGTGECAPTGTGNRSVGRKCTEVSQCNTGRFGTCLDGSNWPNGYCSATNCGSNGRNVCGSGSHCAFASSSGPPRRARCMKSCTSNRNCSRNGFSCYDYDGNGKKECAPSGTGTNGVGGDCRDVSDCAGGRFATCIRNRSFVRGYCSEQCGSSGSGACGSNSHCAFKGTSNRSAFCMADCKVDGDCRQTGYRCYDRDGDGTSECAPAATGSGNSVGGSCSDILDCSGGKWTFCAEDSNSFPGGYCLKLCGSGQGTCPSGSGCFQQSNTSTAFCLRKCSMSNKCTRQNYNCRKFPSQNDKYCIGQ